MVAGRRFQMSKKSIHGAILGTVVGDAIGLPYEALSRRRGYRLLGTPDRHRFLFTRGMMSDDGEHTCMAAASLAEAGGDVAVFRRRLAFRLRWWLLGLPAGVGGATLRAVIKLWFGFSPANSGVYSAGNGPAMRAAVLGAAIQDPHQLLQFVTASTLMTHTDPKALFGAIAVSVAARSSALGESDGQYLGRLEAILTDARAAGLIELLRRAADSSAAGESTAAFAAQTGAVGGVSGYVYQTVPVAIHAWLCHPRDFQKAVTAAVECGGDTDTVAAITGGIVGAAVGPDGIPPTWRDRLLEWPRNPRWIERLARSVEGSTGTGRPAAPPRVGPAVLFRNLLFLAAVFGHIARRALPPY
jgi:ADP-ribosylglycohydrolase